MVCGDGSIYNVYLTSSSEIILVEAKLWRNLQARREVVAIQLLTVGERDFPFPGGHRFVDPETGDELLGDGDAMRREFLARFDDAQRALHARFDAAGIRHAEHVLDQPLDLPLRRLFGARDAAEYT